MRTELLLVIFLGVLSASGMEESAEDRRIFADGLMSRHIFARAAVEYEALLRDYPEVGGRDAILFRWAEALRETGRGVEAEGIYKRVVKEFEGSEFREMSLYKWGTLAKEAGRAEEAVGVFRKILEEGAEGEMRESVGYYLGESLVQVGSLDEAVKSFEGVLREYAGGAYGPYAKLSLGVALVKRDGGGDFERAVGLFRETANGGKAELASDALYRWGDAAFRRGDFAGSAKVFEELIERFPESVQAKECGILAALSEDRANRPEQTLKMVDAALKAPGVERRDEWLYLKGRALFQLGRNEEAVLAFMEVINEFSASAYAVSSCFEGAMAYGALKRYEDAMVLYRLVPVGHGLRAKALRGAGLSAKALGRRDEAIASFRELDKVYPEDEFAESTLGELAYLVQESEQWLEAGGLHRRFGARFPKSERATASLYASGVCFRRGKDVEKALEAWQSLVTGYPSDKLRPETLYLMGEVELERGKTKEALGHFDAYLACGEGANEHRAEAQYCRGTILVRENRLDEALAALRAAEGAHPSEEVLRLVRYHVWLVLQKQNQLDGAADALDVLLRDGVTEGWMDARDVGWAPEHQLSRGKVEEAQRVAKFLVKKAPDDGWRQEAWYWVGRAEAARGNAAAAEAAYRAATDLAVSSNRAAESFVRVGEYRYAGKDYKAAERAFEKGMELAQAQGLESVRVLANVGLARAWRELGRKADAARQLLGICMLYRDDSLIPALIEETIPLLRELGQVAEADALTKDLESMHVEAKE